MALCLYNAVMAYPWATWTSLREAWAVAEHYMQTYSDNLKVYAALLIDAEASDTARGHLALGGKSAPRHLHIDANGKPGDLPTQIWGNYGWSTWCHLIEAAITEAIASNSRGPVTEVAEQKSSITWLIMELEIPLNKLPYLLKMGYITTGSERNGINSIRLHGDVPGAWISSVHMAIQWGMAHQTWADIKLGAWNMKTDGFCRTCGCKGATWEAYCASCWATHLSHKQPAGSVARVPLGASSAEQPVTAP